MIVEIRPVILGMHGLRFEAYERVSRKVSLWSGKPVCKYEKIILVKDLGSANWRRGSDYEFNPGQKVRHTAGSFNKIKARLEQVYGSSLEIRVWRPQ